MGLFKRNKKEDTAKTTEMLPTKEELRESAKNEEFSEDYGLSLEVSQAIDNVIPVISNGDLNLIPSVYNSETLASSLEEATIEDLIILADYTYAFIQKDEKNQQGFGPTFLNCIAAGLASRIKSAEKLYTVYSNALRTPYPQIADGFALIFFKEENANAWVEDYKTNHESDVFVKTLEGDEIKNYFEELIALGILNIGIESNISKLTINHKPIYGIEFETVTNPAVQFLSLRFIQLSTSKIYRDNAKQTHGALLSAIISSKFICPGKTINGNFIAASLKRGDVSLVSVFTDKRELEKAAAENPSAKSFFETAELKEISFTELEPFLMNPQISALAINISGIGFLLKKEIYENLFKAIKEHPDKKLAINIE